MTPSHLILLQRRRRKRQKLIKKILRKYKKPETSKIKVKVYVWRQRIATLSARVQNPKLNYKIF